METPDVTVKVSRELLAELGQWSKPVQVMIERLPTGEYEMIARTYTQEQAPPYVHDLLDAFLTGEPPAAFPIVT